MSQVVKAFLGIFMIMLLAVTSVGILTTFLTITNAQDEHARIINEIENSNFYSEVVKECSKNARENGYDADIVVYYDNETKGADLQHLNDTKDAKAARVKLSVPVKIGFFDLNYNYKLDGYAR
ncbi:hypothetical protein SAMN04487761_10632 [Lachnospiraceae bacterium C7]|nr:hypothetical protein SAMN04487761_10632 [Lachnospiraceae bacterium C7]